MSGIIVGNALTPPEETVKVQKQTFDKRCYWSIFRSNFVVLVWSNICCTVLLLSHKSPSSPEVLDTPWSHEAQWVMSVGDSKLWAANIEVRIIQMDKQIKIILRGNISFSLKRFDCVWIQLFGLYHGLR